MNTSSNNTGQGKHTHKRNNDMINIEAEKDDLSPVKIKKMIFIYNALLNGWTVKCLKENKFEFLKPTAQLKRK